MSQENVKVEPEEIGHVHNVEWLPNLGALLEGFPSIRGSHVE